MQNFGAVKWSRWNFFHLITQIDTPNKTSREHSNEIVISQANKMIKNQNFWTFDHTNVWKFLTIRVPVAGKNEKIHTISTLMVSSLQTFGDQRNGFAELLSLDHTNWYSR